MEKITKYITILCNLETLGSYKLLILVEIYVIFQIKLYKNGINL